MTRYRRRHDRHTPRTWWSLFLRLGGWTALLTGAALVAVTWFSAGALYLADTLDREGAPAYATVSTKRADADSSAGATHYVSFTFKVRGEPGRTVETEVDRAYFEAVEPGDERLIRYLLADPDRVEVDTSRYRRTGNALRWIGLAVGLAGLGALYGFGHAANRAIKVRRHGEKRYAEVTGIRESRLRIGGGRQGRLTWREPDGQVGESLVRSAAWLRETYRPGDQIVVFRLGSHAFWEGDVGPPKGEVTPHAAD